MFGHQPDSQNDTPTDSTVALPTADPVSDGTLDANLTALATSDDAQQSPASDAPALLEEHESDGQEERPALETPVVRDPAPAADTNTLLDIKQQALQQLSPLVGHLDQTPEEKFRTTMMMIQASDNQDLIKSAYEAARDISDEKTRAQALLDVVNEINYFTQHQGE